MSSQSKSLFHKVAYKYRNCVCTPGLAQKTQVKKIYGHTHNTINSKICNSRIRIHPAEELTI